MQTVLTQANASTLVRQAREAMQQDHARGIRLADAALEQAIAEQNIQLQADSLNLLSAGTYRTGAYDESLEYALEAYNYYADFEPNSLYGDLLYTLGSLYLRVGDYTQALRYFQQQQQVAESQHDLESQARGRLGQAAVFTESGELERALNEHQNTLAIFERQRDRRYVVICHNNICSTLWELGRHAEAVIAGRKGLELCPEEPAFDRLRTHLLTTLCLPLVELSQFEEAEKVYQDAMLAANQLEDQRLLAQLLQIRGRYFAARQEYDLAKEHLCLAINRSEELGTIKRTLALRELLASVLRSQGDSAGAFEQYDAANELRKTLFNEHVFARMRNAEVLHRTELSRKEAEVAKAYAAELERLVEQRTADVLKALEQSERTGIVRHKVIETIMHEFRTPLTVISSSANLRHHHAEKLNCEKKAALHARIDKSVKYLAKLLDDVAAVEDSAVRTVHPKPVSTAASEWAASLVDALQAVSNDAAHVSFAVEVAEASQITVDAPMVESIVTELLTNALKYSPENRPITVSITAENDTASITVTDNGIGLAADEIDKVTELFYRSTTAGNIPGIGAGLYTAKLKANAMGGDIAITSAGRGTGTTVTLTLPV